jgi:hypothetical protein
MKNHGSLEDFRLVLHGTAEAPHHLKAGPRVYDENYNTVQNERSVRNRVIISRSYFSFQEKRQSLKSIDRQQDMIESNNLYSNRQPISEETFEDVNAIPNTDSHWLRLLARLNGNWLQ